MPSQPPGLSASDIERLADIIMVMQRCFMQHLSGELLRGRVSFPQFFLLGHISTTEELSMTAIATKMSHTTAAATGLVERLAKLGYLRRSQDATDRRRVLIRITAKGTSLVGRIRQHMIERLTLVAGILSPEDQVVWLRIYEKIQLDMLCQQDTPKPH